MSDEADLFLLVLVLQGSHDCQGVGISKQFQYGVGIVKTCAMIMNKPKKKEKKRIGNT